MGRENLKEISRFSATVICSLLSLAILIGTGIVWWNYREFENNRSTAQCNACAGGSHGSTHDVDGRDQNILIMGNDDRTGLTQKEQTELGAGADKGSLNTDTMMIIHIPADGSKATLISLPRDSLVSIPGVGMQRLNDAYPAGYGAASGTHAYKVGTGADLLTTIVENLTGLSIDHWAMIGLIGFARISNAIGGIKVNMCAAVDDPIITGPDAQGSGFKAAKGLTTLKGPRALEFVRQRHNFPANRPANVDGDFGRMKRQQYFLTATFRQVFTGNVFSKVHDLLGAVQSSIVTDNKLDPLALGAQLQNLTADNIVSHTIPTTYDNGTAYGDVLAVRPAEVQADIRQWIGKPLPRPVPTTTPPPAVTPTSSSPTPTPTIQTAPTAPKTPKPQAIDKSCVW